MRVLITKQVGLILDVAMAKVCWLALLMLLCITADSVALISFGRGGHGIKHGLGSRRPLRKVAVLPLITL